MTDDKEKKCINCSDTASSDSKKAAFFYDEPIIDMKTIKFNFTLEGLEETVRARHYQVELVAVCSTTILPVDGTYLVHTFPAEELPTLFKNISRLRLPHYVGHPATKAILEQELNCTPAPTKLFPGLAHEGTAMLCFPIKQGQSDRSQGGSAVNQEITIDNLDCRIVVRREEKGGG